MFMIARITQNLVFCVMFSSPTCFVTTHTQQEQATYQSYKAVSRRILARFESSRVKSRGRRRPLRQLEGSCAADFAEDKVESGLPFSDRILARALPVTGTPCLPS